MALRRAPWLIGLVAIAFVFLPLAGTIPPTPSTIDFAHLRPIDLRTQSICYAASFAGLLIGWVAAMLSVGDRRAGHALIMPPSYYGFTSLPGHRGAIAALLALACVFGGLAATGLATGLSIWIAIMAATEAATVALLLPVMVRSPVGSAVSLGVLAVTAAASLLSATGSALSFMTALLPPFWIGHTLCADQFGINRGMAAFVGVSLNLMPLAMAAGLNSSDRDAERGIAAGRA